MNVHEANMNCLSAVTIICFAGNHFNSFSRMLLSYSYCVFILYLSCISAAGDVGHGTQPI